VLAVCVARLFGDPAANPSGNPVEVDPMDWRQPAELPPLHKDVDEQKYLKAAAIVKSKIDTNALEAADSSPPPLDDDSDSFELIMWNAPVAYWHSDNRNAAWDDAMLMACSIWTTRPDLAEAALARAQDAGYKGWILPALESRIALSELRWDDSVAYGCAAIDEAPAEWKPIIASWVFTTAMQDYKFELGQKLAGDYSLVKPGDMKVVNKAVADYRARPSDPRLDPAAAIAAGLQEIDHTKRITHVPVKDDFDAVRVKATLDNSGRAVLAPPPGHWQLAELGPPLVNVDLSLHFHFKANGAKHAGMDRDLTIGLVEPREKDVDLCRVDLSVANEVLPAVYGMEADMPVVPAPDWAKDGTLRIIVLHQDMEILVDGQRYYYGPCRLAEDGRRIAFFLKVFDVNATVSQLSWKEIDAGGK